MSVDRSSKSLDGWSAKVLMAKTFTEQLDFNNVLRVTISGLDERLIRPDISELERRTLKSKRKAFALELIEAENLSQEMQQPNEVTGRPSEVTTIVADRTS